MYFKRKELVKFRCFKGPLIDVRSPSEYYKGHLPNSINIPLFDNDERSIIGTIYKKEGLWTRYPGSFCWSLDAPDGHMPLINQLRGVRLMDSILRHPAIAERHNNIL